jgi:hypothetical protein
VKVQILRNRSIFITKRTKRSVAKSTLLWAYNFFLFGITSSSSSSSSIGTTTLGLVSACSTVVEHSQQEGFTECRCQRHVKPPTWRRMFGITEEIFSSTPQQLEKIIPVVLIVTILLYHRCIQTEM